MKKHFKPLLFMTLCFFLLPIQVSAKTETTEQAEPISYVTITDGKVNKKNVKSGDTLKYQFTINDLGISEHDKDQDFDDGICYVTVTWKSSKKQQFTRRYDWKDEKAKSMTISDKIKIMDGMQSGKWKISEIVLYSGEAEDDAEGHIHLYGTQTDQNASKLKNYSEMYVKSSADLSFADFKVKKKKGSKVDKKAPTIDISSLKISKSKVKVNKKVTFSVKVKDASKVEYVKSSWQSYGDGTYYNIGSIVDVEMKYNKKKKCYEGKLSIGDYDSKLELIGISTRDIYGNSTYYGEKYQNAFSKIVMYKK